MPTYTYKASATRWLRQYRAPLLTPVYASASAAAEAQRQLAAAEWRKLRREIVPVLPSRSDDAVAGALPENYDAYLACGEHADGLHRAFAGCACYRVTLPPAAVGLTLESLSVGVVCDPYNLPGARVAVAASDDAAPSADCDVIREGDVYAEGVAPRTQSPDGKLWYGATATAALTPEGGIVLKDYLYIYVSLERYDRSRNGWLEGAAHLVPEFTIELDAAIDGYADGAWIGGGYDLETPDSLVIAPLNTPPDFPRHKSYASDPSGTTPRREFSREFFWCPAKVFSAATNDDRRALAGLVQGAAMGAYDDTSILHPDKVNGSTDTMPYLKLHACAITSLNATGASGVNQNAFYINQQFGLVASAGHSPQVNVEGNTAYKSPRVTLRLCPYVLPLGVPPFTVSRIILKNNATPLSLGGAVVRITAWFVPGYSALHDASYPLYPLTALARKETFWTGLAETVSGTATDRTSSGDATAINYALDAVRLGRVDLYEGIAADAETVIACETAPDTFGMVILAPMVMDAGTSLAADSRVGLASSFAYTSAGNNTGWRPEVRVEP